MPDDTVSRPNFILQQQPGEELAFVFHRSVPDPGLVVVGEGTYELGIVSRLC
jgi:hypothetical protein